MPDFFFKLDFVRINSKAQYKTKIFVGHLLVNASETGCKTIKKDGVVHRRKGVSFCVF